MHVEKPTYQLLFLLNIIILKRKIEDFPETAGMSKECSDRGNHFSWYNFLFSGPKLTPSRRQESQPPDPSQQVDDAALGSLPTPTSGLHRTCTP